MPTQQKNGEKTSEVIRFVFRVSGALARLSFTLFNRKLRFLGILGKSLETAVRLGTKDKKSACSLKTEHPIANTNLAKIQKKAEEIQSQLSSQLETLPLKNESAAMAEQINTIKTEIDQLIQQVCDCSSQTQPGALETAIQQNKGSFNGPL